jgi:hypothetical protein
MAERPIFIPTEQGAKLVHTEYVNFHWFPGLSITQKQRSIGSLHREARKFVSTGRILEISSKSREEIGNKLSAFKLTIKTVKHGIEFSVESAFQSSKVFERGGPYIDILEKEPREAKRDPRLRASGRLVGFRFFGVDWDLRPETAFYDWLYINALKKKPDLANQVLSYSAFTDIEFNPERSVNCQAYSAALYWALYKRGLLTDDVLGKETFLDIMRNYLPGSARGKNPSLRFE